MTRPVTWNNQQYPSMRDAANALGVTPEAMRKRVNNGYACDADLKRPAMNLRPVVWNGTRYASLSEAARQLGISVHGMYHRVEKGYTCDEDLP